MIRMNETFISLESLFPLNAIICVQWTVDHNMTEHSFSTKSVKLSYSHKGKGGERKTDRPSIFTTIWILISELENKRNRNQSPGPVPIISPIQSPSNNQEPPKQHPDLFPPYLQVASKRTRPIWRPSATPLYNAALAPSNRNENFQNNGWETFCLWGIQHEKSELSRYKRFMANGGRRNQRRREVISLCLSFEFAD